MTNWDSIDFNEQTDMDAAASALASLPMVEGEPFEIEEGLVRLILTGDSGMLDLVASETTTSGEVDPMFVRIMPDADRRETGLQLFDQLAEAVPWGLTFIESTYYEPLKTRPALTA